MTWRIFLIFVVLLAFISFLLTFIIKYFAHRHKLFDIPNERSSHTVATPRGGGLAIVVTWYLGISILLYFNIIDTSLYFALISGSLLAIISFIDDLLDIKPIFRIIIQIISASLAIFFLKDFIPIGICGYKINLAIIIYPVMVIGIVWFINLFNFLDGIDAYASIEAICIVLVLFFFTNNPINLILIACISGFLFWNWPKAKIFMGDIGSTQLGFIIIVLGIYFHNKLQFSIINWLMLTSVFWFDASLTLYRRWKNKEKLSRAHRKHAYQRFVQAGFSHLQTGIFLLILNFIIFAMIYLSRINLYFEISLFAINIGILYLITLKIDQKVPFKKK